MMIKEEAFKKELGGKKNLTKQLNLFSSLTTKKTLDTLCNSLICQLKAGKTQLKSPTIKTTAMEKICKRKRCRIIRPCCKIVA